MKSHNSDGPLRSIFGLARQIVLALLMVSTGVMTLSLTAGQAHAQACCTATGGGEFAVVGRCHQSVVTGQLTFEPTLGTYDSNGTYRSFEGTRLYDTILTVGAGSRFGTERFQAYGNVPLRLQYRELAGMDGGTGWGVGDASLGVRYTLLEDLMIGIEGGRPDTYAPFLDIYLNGHIPSGRAPDSSNDPVGADITGNGHWGMTGGIRASKFLNIRHVIGAYAEASQYFNRDIERLGSTVSYRPGTEVGFGLTYMHLVSVFWSWGMTAGLHHGFDAWQGGQVLSDSGTRRLVVGAHLTRDVAFPFWEVTLSATNDAWGDHLGKNLPFVGPSVGLSLQRNFL